MKSMSRTSGDGEGRSARSVLLVVVLAIGLLAGPLWVEVLHLDDRVYRYERVEVATQGGTIEYVSDANDPGVAISEDIACSGAIVSRTCYLERGLIGNRTAPTSRYTSGNVSGRSIESEYRFVAGSEAVYRVAAVLNRSQGFVVENGSVRPVDEDSASNERVLYRVDLDLERVSTTTVLDSVSVDVKDVAPPVREAARTGSVRTYSPVEVTETPVKLDDGSIYRVHLAAQYGPPETGRTAVLLLRYLAPLAGLLLGYSVLRGFLRAG